MANAGMCRWTERCQSTESRHTRHKRAIIKRHLISTNRNMHPYIIQIRTPGKLTKCITKNYKVRWIYYKLRQYNHCVGRLWSWAAMIKPSISALRPAAFSHLWVLSWFTSACFTSCGYLPWSAFDSHLDLSCWRLWCLALAFVLRA